MADSEALRGGAKTAESGGSNHQVREEKNPKEREGLPNGKVGAKLRPNSICIQSQSYCVIVMDEISNISSKSTFPILCGFQAAPVACEMLEAIQQYQIFMFQVGQSR